MSDVVDLDNYKTGLMHVDTSGLPHMNLLQILSQPHVSAQKSPRRLKKNHDVKCSTSLAWVPESLPGTEHTSPSPNGQLLSTVALIH